MNAKFRDGSETTRYSLRPPPPSPLSPSAPPKSSMTRLKAPEPPKPARAIESEEIVADLARDPRHDDD